MVLGLRSLYGVSEWDAELSTTCIDFYHCLESLSPIRKEMEEKGRKVQEPKS